MNMCRKKKGRMLVALSAAFAVAFVAAPAAVGGGPERLDPWAYNVISKHSAGQEVASGPVGAGIYDRLDPWAYNEIHALPTALLTEHSVGQDANRKPIEPVTYVVSAAEAAGFDWRAAAVGAAATFGLMLMVAAGTMLRKRRGVVHAHP
jgi:hypothetical protein